MRTINRVAASLMMLALPGCGSSNTIWVTGSLLKGGAPFKPPEGRSNQVVLIAMEVKDDSGKGVGANQPYPATVNPDDGTFEVPGPDGRGIYPGKYRISITQTQRTARPAPSKKRGQKVIDRDTDYLEDRYGPTTSPIVRELKVSQKLEIDLDRPTESPSQ